jgi:selenocysteine lyase/cysteine desulfurase
MATPNSFQNAFDLDPETIYLNHAAVSPWPIATVETVERFAQENGRLGARHYPDWLKIEQQLRERLARLINASSTDDIALLKNTSEGLSMIAQGLEWQAGDNLVSISQEFPSNRVVWESLEPQGVEVRKLDLSASSNPEVDLIDLCDDRTRLISVSSVQYASGLRLDLRQLGKACRERGILFCVDAIQSLGVIAFDLQDCQADFVVADGHKWMLGAEGLALFYCRPSLRERLRLQQFGWHMLEDAWDFERKAWRPSSTAQRFECGSPNMLGIHALNASLGVIESLGIMAIQQRVAELTEQIIMRIDRLGLELLSPRSGRRRSGIVTFRVPEKNNPPIQQQLMQRGIICASRGGGIRFSPHFHNRPEQLDTAFNELEGLL